MAGAVGYKQNNYVSADALASSAFVKGDAKKTRLATGNPRPRFESDTSLQYKTTYLTADRFIMAGAVGFEPTGPLLESGRLTINGRPCIFTS